jgi:hypothetical protein
MPAIRSNRKRTNRSMLIRILCSFKKARKFSKMTFATDVLLVDFTIDNYVQEVAESFQ